MLLRLRYCSGCAKIPFRPLVRHFRRTLLQLQPMRKIASSNPKLENIGDLIFAEEFSHPIGNKVTIVGAGEVGMAAAFSILAQNVTNEICLIDTDEKKVRGEVLDLQQGSCFLNSPKISGSSDYAESACSRVCVVTPGMVRKEGETRLDLVQRNGDIIQQIIPELVKHSPETILVIASNPVDVMSYVAWKVSKLPMKRVIGSGTTLDSVRFRQFIAQRLNVSPSSCHGWIIGEHGYSMVIAWSGVEVGGVRLRDFSPDIGIKEDPQEWHLMHEQVNVAADEIIQNKGNTSWAIGLCLSGIVRAILDNTDKIMAVSTMAKGQHCIDDEVYLSLPCTLNANGISAIVQLVLSDVESELLQKSAQIIKEAQAKVKFS